jgi:hypothetical protein
MKWRWDQGRLEYFQFDEIRSIAKALSAFDGQHLSKGEDADHLRVLLSEYSEKTFLPNDYKVWRNYKRVFGCQMLATDRAGFMLATDLCKKLATGAVTADEYFLHFARNFAFSSPVFKDYDSTVTAVFPVCVIVKKLVANFTYHGRPFISLDEVFKQIQNFGVTGREPLSFYHHVNQIDSIPSRTEDENRQVRELLRFVSQFSFLKWESPNLFLDISTLEEAQAIVALFEPESGLRLADAAQELLRIGQLTVNSPKMEMYYLPLVSPIDSEFTEGGRVRISHLRVERSGKLKQLFFKNAKDPHVCNMCSMNTQNHYPWADRLIELHHLLPLGSPIRVNHLTSSVEDLVGLCPSCHRATHKFYSNWLSQSGQLDFSSRFQAIDVYKQATSQFVQRHQS